MTDPWPILRHYADLLESRLPAADGQPYKTACSINTQNGDWHRANNLDELEPMLRPHDMDAITWIAVERTAFTAGFQRKVHVYVWMNRKPWRLDIDVEGDDEAFVLGWRETAERESTYAISATTDRKQPSRSAPAPSQQSTVASVPTKGSWWRDLSVQFIGGLLVVIAVAVAGVLWAVLR